MDIKYTVFMAKNDNGTKNISHINRRVNFFRNGEKWKINKIEWCEGGLQLEDISTKNVGENGLNPRIYISW